jgi:predicted metal-binding membrane protein
MIQESGRKHILYGAVWIVLGVLISVVSYLGALGTDKPAIITWGLVALGGIQMIRGCYQYMKGRATVVHYTSGI